VVVFPRYKSNRGGLETAKPEVNRNPLEDLNSDGVLATRKALIAFVGNALFTEKNGTWDRERGNDEITVLASAARTTSANSSDITNYNARGAIFFINVTAVSGSSPTLNILIQMVDPVSAGTAVIAQLTANITGTGQYVLIVYPGATDVGVDLKNPSISEAQDVPLPRTHNVRYEIGGTTPSFTFSVGAGPIV